MDSHRRQAGFSALEALIAMLLLLVVMAVAFRSYIDTSRTYKSELSGVDMHQAARVALDELGRGIAQTGYGVYQPDVYNATTWQRGVVYAGAHAFAMNADLDTALGPLDGTQKLAFPTGDTYAGEGPSTTTDGAETYVFTLDANDDGDLTDADRAEAPEGSYNPAAGTDNPLDFAVFRRVHGYDGTAYITQLTPLTPYLFTNALPGVKYPDGTIPEPLFSYLMTEDINRDGVLADTECVNDVVDTCPPSAARDPLLYLWGDSNFDGALDDTERSVLRTMPVGSPAWSKNPLVESGNLIGTSLATAYDPTEERPVVKVADETKFVPGSHIRIGEGANAETAVVTEIIPNSLVLSTALDLPHASGSKVTMLPERMLGAIRAVQINFTSVAEHKDQDSSTNAPAGQIGRVTEHGMEYRTLTLQKTVRMPNQSTVALAVNDVSRDDFRPTCPLSVLSYCSGSSLARLWSFGDSEVPLTFRVGDKSGDPADGVELVLTNSDSTLGGFASAKVVTDGSGLATVRYRPSGKSGTDKITATASCQDQSFSDVVEVNAVAVDVARSPDCVGTVSSRNSQPESSFSIQVRDSQGTVYNAPMNLHLEIDPDYVYPPSFESVAAELYVNGQHAGSTGSEGFSPAFGTTTGGSGVINGAVRLKADNTAGGVRVNVVAEAPDIACKVSGGRVSTTVSFYDLTLDSLTPISGCREGIPCTIPADSEAPEVQAVLSMAGKPIPGAEVAFSTTDKHDEPDDPPAASALSPEGSQTTGDLGEVVVAVGNNGSTSITPSNPLLTLVEAVSPGPPSCSNGLIRSDVLAAFLFEGAVDPTKCSVDAQQGWLQRIDARKLCLDVFNLNELGECPLAVKGVRVDLFDADGVTLDTVNTVKKIEGGGTDTLPGCTSDNRVTLFEAKCMDPDRQLNHGERWDFGTNECKLPQYDLGAQQYFGFTKFEWEKDVLEGRRLDMTIYYGCTGACDDGNVVEQTFQLVVPPN